jgi:SAM-dependent methyltransferase
VREKPANYGTWWNTNELDQDWYRSIYDVRPRAHEAFLDWFGSIIRQGERITSILEVGCGRGLPYARLFAGHGYVGCDISEKEIAYCQATHPQGNEGFFVADAIENDLHGPYDLVFSHAVIDHVYDADRFLRKLVQASCAWLYVSAYRGWYPGTSQHMYTWYEPTTCFMNDLSPDRTAESLIEAGSRQVAVFPHFVGNRTDSISWETVAIARGTGRRRS